MAAGEGTVILRPFVCVGLAYFAIGVIVPIVLLQLWGEQGHWSVSGLIWSLAAGAAGAAGALGLLFAFYFRGRPVYVMPLIFGGAPIVNSFLTIVLGRLKKHVNSVFGAGLVMVILGAVLVLIFRPGAAVGADEGGKWTDFIWQIVFIALTIVCWGAYGPMLHKGQAAMDQSRLRPFLCVGLAYFLIAVLVPNMLLMTTLEEPSTYAQAGTLWSLLAGAAGAVGALGIILAFNFGGRPVYVMPLVFGGAPVVNSFWTIVAAGRTNEVRTMFMTGLVLVLAGSVMVLIFAPRGAPPPPPKESPKREDAEEAAEKTADPEEAAPDE
jgi:hypothetical protein